MAKKYILLNLLNSFEPNEIKQFSKLVESTYFNTDNYAVRLLNALKKNVLEKKRFDEPLQVIVFEETFLEEKVKNHKLNNNQKKLLRAKMSVLTKLGKEFLMIKALKDNIPTQQFLLNKILLEKKQFQLFGRLLNTGQDQLSKKKSMSMEDYNYALQIERGKMNFLYQQGQILKEDNLSEVIHYLDLQYLLNKLDLYGTMLSLQNIMSNKHYDFSSMDAIEPILNLPAYKNNPLIFLHKTKNNLLENYNNDNYKQLIKLLNQFDDNVPTISLADFYTVACNFCSIQIRKGKSDFYQELYKLYKIMNEKDLIINNKNIEINKLKNIIIAGCRVSDFDWSFEMANKYYPFIKKEARKSVHHYNLGIIEFYQSNFKKAISHFIHVDKVNVIFDLEARIQLLKSYYEMDLNYDERTLQIFRSAERFIQGNKQLSNKIKMPYKNFIQLLINLYRIKHRVGKRTIEGIWQKLDNMKLINDKKWLVDKINQIKK